MLKSFEHFSNLKMGHVLKASTLSPKNCLVFLTVNLFFLAQ